MFWGLTIEPGKHYTQTVEESFHVSMAALETRLDHVTESGGEKSGVVQVIVKHEKAEFLLCSLFFGTVFQQPLDLNFTEGEEVTFFTEGRGTVHLTGYLVKEEPLDIDQDMMSLEDASSSEDIDVSSEGMASGEESATQQQVANKPCKRKKKRTRWKSRDGDRKSGLHRHRRKRRKTEKGDRINPQRTPHEKSGDVKETGNPISVHMRKWTTSVVANVRTENDKTSKSEEVPDDGRTSSVSSNLEDVQKSLPPQVVIEHKGSSSASSPHVVHVKQQASDSDLDKTKDGSGASSSLQHGGEIGSVIGSVLQETISVPSPKTPVRTEDFTPPPAKAPVRTNDYIPPPVSSKHSEPMLNVNQSTQNVATIPSPTPSTSQSASTVHKPSITAQPSSGASRTKETIEEVATGGSSRSGNESVKEEEEEEVLIEEIKIEDDSDEEANPPFSSSSISAASSSMPSQQTLPRITSVTSMSSQRQQQILGDPRIDMIPHHFQEPPSWNIPGPSRAGMSSSQHGGSLLPEQFIPPVPLPPPQERLHLHPASHLVPVGLAMHDDDQDVLMGHRGGEMGDMEDEEGEAILSEEVLAAMPVATEMGELGPDDLQIDGVDISQQQILLTRGYRVFLTRGQLYDVQISARETTKTPWSVCVRRLMDIYFDRQTLAMGKATSHGVSSNPARKTLNQEVIQAIKVFATGQFEGVFDKDVNYVVVCYCRDTRKAFLKQLQAQEALSSTSVFML